MNKRNYKEPVYPIEECNIKKREQPTMNKTNTAVKIDQIPAL